MDTVTSRTNDRVKRIAELCANVRTRRELGLCALFGLKLSAEVSSRSELAELWAEESVFSKRRTEIERIIPLSRVTLMSESVLEKLSDQKCPDGIISITRIPDELSDGELFASQRALLLCGVQDPANVGASVRTAAAFGYSSVLLCGECADPFSPKALRASMGAAFSVRLRRKTDALSLVPSLRENGFYTAATALDKNARPITELKDREKLALLIGNEGSGLESETIALCDASAYIPITGGVESLNANAAAAVAMWETRL